MSRSQTPPPPLDYFSSRRPTFGDDRVTVVLDPLELELAGLDATLAELLFDRY